MSIFDEERVKAREHRRKMEARNRFKLQREQQMAGDPQAYRDLLDDYAPLIRDIGWDPTPTVPEDVDDRFN